MNRRIRSVHRTTTTRTESFHRYLKPGALAQLRDSRISARSNRVDSHSQICLYRAPSSPSSSPSQTPIHADQIQVNVVGGFPCFSGRIYVPRCPQRKKIVSAKSVYFLTSNPASPVVSDSPESVLDMFSTDVLVAH